MAALKVYDLLYAAYRIAGVLRGPMRGLSNSEQLEGIECLNSLFDEWSANRLNIFTMKQQIFNLVAGQQTYTIGIDPTGATTADFNVKRPENLHWANLITQIGSAPYTTRVPMVILGYDQWAAIRVQNTGSSIPQWIYDDYNDPISTLYLWPYPNASAQLELYTWQALDQYTGVTQDVVRLPPAYRKAVEFNLARDISARYPQYPWKPQAEQQAVQSLAFLQAINSPTPILQCDLALLDARKTYFNYLTGDPT